MSSRHVRRIACDHDDCSRSLTLQTEHLTDLRRHAQDSGWRVNVAEPNPVGPYKAKSVRDFCPEHA